MGVESMMQSIQLEQPKATQDVFELPCGYIDANGMLHTEVAIREVTGAEEDLLASKNIPPLKKFTEFLSRCVTRIGSITDRQLISTIVKKLPIGDRVFIMFAVRRVTLGDQYHYKHKCPNEACNQVCNYSVDLSTLEVKRMVDKMKRIYDITLPSGKTARFRISTGEDEERVQKYFKEDSPLSKAILMRLELFDNKPPDLQSVISMSLKDRQALRRAFDSAEGGVETEIEMTCPSCGYEFSSDLEISGGFFFPSET